MSLMSANSNRPDSTTSFTLAKTGSTTVTVANDPTATTTAVTNFVNGYNALRTQLNTLTNIDTSNKANNLQHDHCYLCTYVT